jgi:hypothetical protein
VPEYGPWAPPAVLLIPIFAIIGGITLAIVNSINRSRVRELEIKERIAMIERGLVPAPESDPKGFERAMRSRLHDDWDGFHESIGPVTDRHRRVGMILIGVGCGLLILLAPSIRVGGFLIVLGVAFLVSSFFERPRQSGTRRPPPASGPEAP